MSAFPYVLTGPIGSRSTLGMVVLQTDETIEHDFRRIFVDPDLALYISRIPSGDTLNPDSIADMEIALPHAASLLPPAATFDVVGYACTSGTTLIGADRVAELVQSTVETRNVANPLTAALSAMKALNVGSVGLVTPYIDVVAQQIRTAFEGAGFNVPSTVSFGEEVEARVARIDPMSIAEAATEVARGPGVEAVFLSCTNLRTLDIIDDLEQKLGMPVVSSNQAMAWHMAQLADIPTPKNGPGRLFQTSIKG